MWLEVAKDQDQQFAVQYMKKLANLRQKQNVSDEDWREQVLYSTEVQNILTWAARCRKDTNDLLQKQQLTTALLDIMDPIDNVQLCYFSKLNDIRDSIDDSEKRLERLEITELTELPHILSKCLTDSEEWVTEEEKCKYIQKRMELTVKYWSQRKDSSLEYILCNLVLRLNGFDMKSFRFEFLLSKQDMEDLVENLEENFSHFESIKERSKKQAYLLLTALECKRDRHAAWQETVNAIPDISKKITAIMEEAKRGEPNIDLDKFQKDIIHFLRGQTFSFDPQSLKSLTEFLKCQFDEICTDSTEDTDVAQKTAAEKSEHQLDKSVDKILIALDMKRFYPQKLTYEDVIMLISNAKNGSVMKPATLQDLPWYFLRQIVALDSSVRETCYVSSQQDFGDESSFDLSDSDIDLDEESGDDTVGGDVENQNESKITDTELKLPDQGYVTSVNPLDLIYAVFLCADDFLRQEIVDKIARCQYAFPLVLPSPNDDPETSQSLVLHWSLKSITRLFYDDKKLVHKTLVDVETPIISCMNFGDETSWKSKIMNRMLSPVQETFWHEGLMGGDCRQEISKGMVEVAWYLPGGHEDDQFSSPVAFANYRGKRT